MKDLFCNSVFFGLAISILSFQLGILLQRKFKLAIFNPIFISIAVVIVVLLVFNIDYESYLNGAKILNHLLTPATVCLAIPLYEQLSVLRHNAKAVLIGIVAGVVTSMVMIFLFACLFRFSHEMYVTLLPKSITTAIGMGQSEKLGGIVALTAAVITVTGVFGNMTAAAVCRLFRITDPVAKGVAIGTSSHAAGTAKAMEMGEIEGAMSSLSIVICGLFTVIAASIFAQFL